MELGKKEQQSLHKLPGWIDRYLYTFNEICAKFDRLPLFNCFSHARCGPGFETIYMKSTIVTQPLISEDCFWVYCETKPPPFPPFTELILFVQNYMKLLQGKVGRTRNWARKSQLKQNPSNRGTSRAKWVSLWSRPEPNFHCTKNDISSSEKICSSNMNLAVFNNTGLNRESPRMNMYLQASFYHFQEKCAEL